MNDEQEEGADDGDADRRPWVDVTRSRGTSRYSEAMSVETFQRIVSLVNKCSGDDLEHQLTELIEGLTEQAAETQVMQRQLLDNKKAIVHAIREALFEALFDDGLYGERINLKNAATMFDQMPRDIAELKEYLLSEDLINRNLVGIKGLDGDTRDMVVGFYHELANNIIAEIDRTVPHNLPDRA